MLFMMTAAVYLDGGLSLVYRHVCFCTLTRTHDHGAARAHRTSAGGDDMPCGAEWAQICVPIRVEMSGGKNACAIAIDHRMAVKRN